MLSCVCLISWSWFILNGIHYAQQECQILMFSWRARSLRKYLVYKDFQSNALQVREGRLLNYFLDTFISFGLESGWSLMSEICINIQPMILLHLIGNESSMKFSPSAVSIWSCFQDLLASGHQEKILLSWKSSAPSCTWASPRGGSENNNLCLHQLFLPELMTCLNDRDNFSCALDLGDACIPHISSDSLMGLWWQVVTGL